MAHSTSLSRPIIEALYEEALILADDVRSVFARDAQAGDRMGANDQDVGALEGSDTSTNQLNNDAANTPTAISAAPDVARQEQIISARLALSSEGLRATTRIMHILAWLLNQRAFYSGELTQAQVLINGTLPPDRASDASMLDLLEPATRALIERTEYMHQRIARLDRDWRSGLERPSPALSLQNRLERSLRKL